MQQVPELGAGKGLKSRTLVQDWRVLPVLIAAAAHATCAMSIMVSATSSIGKL